LPPPGAGVNVKPHKKEEREMKIIRNVNGILTVDVDGILWSLDKWTNYCYSFGRVDLDTAYGKWLYRFDDV